MRLKVTRGFITIAFLFLLFPTVSETPGNDFTCQVSAVSGGFQYNISYGQLRIEIIGEEWKDGDGTVLAFSNDSNASNNPSGFFYRICTNLTYTVIHKVGTYEKKEKAHCVPECHQSGDTMRGPPPPPPPPKENNSHVSYAIATGVAVGAGVIGILTFVALRTGCYNYCKKRRTGEYNSPTDDEENDQL